MRAGADSQIQLRQNAIHRAGHRVVIVQHILPEILVVPQNAPVIDKHRGDGQICQAVLDTAVLKIGAAKLPG